jgi:hypothetical protein
VKGSKYISFALSLALATVMTTGCGSDKDSDEANKYETIKAIDDQDYDKAIANLKDGCAGYNQVECNMLLGSAYYAKAGWDLTTIGKELVKIDNNSSLDQDAKDKELTSVIYDKLFSENMKIGIDYYKKALSASGFDSSVCNPKDYDNTLKTIQQKDICLAINPILLKDKLNDDETSSDDNGSVSLEQIIQFKEVIENPAIS